MIEICKSVVESATLTLNLDIVSGAPRLRFHVTNRGRISLWLPIEQEPSYREDSKANTLTFFYGYFDELYRTHREHYMLPAMQEVRPGQETGWELENATLIANIFRFRYRTQARVRVALRAFPQSRTRGAQDLDGYLKESCVIESAAFVP